jgi:hypothetical protein
MALRFRDLVATTVDAHRALIAKHGYVWWGWWNKPNERIPRDAFAEFQGRIKPGQPLDVFLVDSGTHRLYRAALTQIQPAPSEAEIPCPEPKRTPAYYRTRKYKAWFRLNEIVDIPAEELRHWSYAEVPNFIDDPHADRFDQKRVFDLGECSVAPIAPSIFCSGTAKNIAITKWNYCRW